jgi:hypothetical protein
VSAADIDGDGDMDVVGTVRKSSMEVGWQGNSVAPTPGEQDNIEIDLGRGPVTVNVPASYDPAQLAPLVMLLHGYSMTGQTQKTRSHPEFLRVIAPGDQAGEEISDTLFVLGKCDSAPPAVMAKHSYPAATAFDHLLDDVRQQKLHRIPAIRFQLTQKMLEPLPQVGKHGRGEPPHVH